LLESSLEDMVKIQGIKIAPNRINKVKQTKRLEDQELVIYGKVNALENLIIKFNWGA
jgi:hypothetical protein